MVLAHRKTDPRAAITPEGEVSELRQCPYLALRFLSVPSLAFAALTIASPANAQTAPYGYFDDANKTRLAGWAVDNDINSAYNYTHPTFGPQTGAIVVHAHIYPVDENDAVTGSVIVYGAMADGCRTDVGCHAFHIDVTQLPPGRYRATVYALGVNNALTPGQYGHPGNLDGNNPPLSGTNPRYFEIPNKTLSYPGFTCDVYAASTKRVLQNDSLRVTYDFSVTKLSDTNYLSVFHADRLDLANCNNGAQGGGGDSVAARYASSPDGYFGDRTGNGDKIVTTTVNPSTYMFNNPLEPWPSCGDNYSGGANPILVYTGAPGGESPWSVLWVSVAGGGPSFRHYLHLGNLTNINDIHNSSWSVLAENGGFPWATFAGAPYYRDYNPTPVRNWPSGAHLESDFVTPNVGFTNGLIGNISRDAALTNSYYFYNDAEVFNPAVPCPASARFQDPSNGQLYCRNTMRRRLYAPDVPNWFMSPDRVMWDWVTKVAYHPARGRWMVLHHCGADGPCLQFAGADVDSVRDTYHGGNLVPVTSAGSTLKLGYAPETNSQWGILKNKYGQVAGDDFRLYFRPGCEGCNYGGSSIRSLRVVCSPQ
jgi:hypothetical protein